VERARCHGDLHLQSAYRRCREWTEAGVFEAFWWQGLIEYDGLKGIDWSWLSMDPLALAIEGANRHDMKLVRSTLEGIMAARPLPTVAMPHGLCLDKGYDFDEVRSIVREFGFTAHIRARGEEARAIKEEAGFKARRWVVERTHSWMNRFRRILVRWEKLPETFIAMLHLACGIITWRATGLLK
jgi:transposase